MRTSADRRFATLKRHSDDQKADGQSAQHCAAPAAENVDGPKITNPCFMNPARLSLNMLGVGLRASSDAARNQDQRSGRAGLDRATF
jgi:hypothetical protein